MDQESTKDGSGSSDRRNWRERLGVGQDLPKISDEFKTTESDPKPTEGNGLPGGAGPGTPVARPAPMAPRYSRPAAPADSGSPRPATQDLKPNDSKRFSAATLGRRPLATPTVQAHKPGDAPRLQWQRSGTGQTQSSASGSQRPAYSPPMSPLPNPQRPAPPSRGPAAYPQAAPRSGAAPAATGNASFSERLRAQREAAERLAQQRLAAARERSSHASAEAKTVLSPRTAQPAPRNEMASQRAPNESAKPADGEQPRFTFAKEEIVAARQEAVATPAADSPKDQAAAPPYSPPKPHKAGPQPQGWSEPGPLPSLEEYGARAAGYRHEDDAMFEDERTVLQPALQGDTPRASAADYSAAYREFEDEFEEAPRRGGGPLFLLLSLLALAVVSGGAIYWYQQSEGSPAPEAADVPVIPAPQESAKADPEPLVQPQQAVQPTRRKQIYDRILGEETLEPERIVPTEEEPQLRQVQQPELQQPRAVDEGQSQSQSPADARQDQSTEPLPLPLPPPPGTGEQGDLLVPGGADTQTAASSPEPARLVLPEPVAEAAATSQATAEPGSGETGLRLASREPAGPSPESAAPPSPSEAPAAEAIYPEPTSELAYPEAAVERPPQDPASEPDEAPVEGPAQIRADETEASAIAALPDPQSARQPEPAAEPGPEATPGSDVPLPRAKPEPPARTTAKTAPQVEPQRQSSAPQPSGSGPVQILPTDLVPNQAPAEARAAQQPQTQQFAPKLSPRAGTVGREFDPLAGSRPAFSGSPGAAASPAAVQTAPAAPRQVASVAPDAVRSQPGSAGGYVVQLASFRSESEALSEFQRLAQRYPQLVGELDSRVQQASLGQSGTFYRLGIGPVADRNTATKLCNDLIAAGEKDCLVRRN